MGWVQVIGWQQATVGCKLRTWQGPPQRHATAAAPMYHNHTTPHLQSEDAGRGLQEVVDAVQHAAAAHVCVAALAVLRLSIAQQRAHAGRPLRHQLSHLQRSGLRAVGVEGGGWRVGVGWEWGATAGRGGELVGGRYLLLPPADTP